MVPAAAFGVIADFGGAIAASFCGKIVKKSVIVGGDCILPMQCHACLFLSMKCDDLRSFLHCCALSRSVALRYLCHECVDNYSIF